MSPSPHRISLARGWRTTDGRWERIFHSPTLPLTVTQVHLVIDPCPQGSRIRLNGSDLAWRERDSRLDCDIRSRIQSVNRLVVEIPEATLAAVSSANDEASRTHSPFDIYLEIFEDE